jgi:hypothetical protein
MPKTSVYKITKEDHRFPASIPKYTDYSQVIQETSPSKHIIAKLIMHLRVQYALETKLISKKAGIERGLLPNELRFIADGESLA